MMSSSKHRGALQRGAEIPPKGPGPEQLSFPEGQRLMPLSPNTTEVLASSWETSSLQAFQPKQEKQKHHGSSKFGDSLVSAATTRTVTPRPLSEMIGPRCRLVFLSAGAVLVPPKVPGPGGEFLRWTRGLYDPKVCRCVVTLMVSQHRRLCDIIKIQVQKNCGKARY